MAPAGKPRHFHYLHDALQRGCMVRVLTKPVRAALAREGPEGFYQVLVVESSRGGTDDIDIELLTREAVVLYFAKLTERGILCVHVSNRHLDLAPVMANIAASLGFACRHARDSSPDESFKPGEDRGRFGSEWVMVARKEKYLEHLQAPPGYKDGAKQFWRQPAPSGRPVWHDTKPVP